MEDNKEGARTLGACPCIPAPFVLICKIKCSKSAVGSRHAEDLKLIYCARIAEHKLEGGLV